MVPGDPFPNDLAIRCDLVDRVVELLPQCKARDLIAQYGQDQCVAVGKAGPIVTAVPRSAVSPHCQTMLPSQSTSPIVLFLNIAGMPGIMPVSLPVISASWTITCPRTPPTNAGSSMPLGKPDDPSDAPRCLPCR